MLNNRVKTDDMREMNEKLGVETVTTAAESPFSNGICERHNAILFESMSKTLEDTKCEPELALAWALSAKNALQNKNGFSPNQLVFGHNVNLPTVLTDLPPALEPTTSSDIIRANLNAMHSARANYIKAESSEKIRRALRHKTRTYADEIFNIGEKVFYKRRNLKGWRGPAVATGLDDKIILVRHGSAYYRCHPCHLMKVKESCKEKVNVQNTVCRKDKDAHKRVSRKKRDFNIEDDEVEESENELMHYRENSEIDSNSDDNNEQITDEDEEIGVDSTPDVSNISTGEQLEDNDQLSYTEPEIGVDSTQDVSNINW